MKHFSKKYILLAVIVLIGSFLRLYHIEEKGRFIWDEGRDMLAIRHMLVNRDITLFGPYNEQDNRKDFFGVFHYYLMAPALWIANYDPAGPAYFTAFLGIMSILLCYWLVRLWETEGAAIITTLIFSLSPLLVKYSQWAWNPNTTPFFGLLFLIISTYIYKKPRVWMSGLAGIVLGLLFQLHYFTAVLSLFWVGIMMVKKPRHAWKHWLLFIGGAILPNLSFVVFDLTHEHFYWKILTDSFIGRGQQQLFSFHPIAWIVSPWTTTVVVMKSLWGSAVFGIVASIFYWIGFIFSVYYSRTRHALSFSLLMGVCWILFCLGTGLFPGLVDDYHALPYVVGHVVTIVWFMVICFKQLYPFVMTICMVGIIFGLFSANNVLRQPIWSENAPLTKQVSTVISNDVQKQPFNVISLIDADTRATRFRYFLDVNNTRPFGITEYPETSKLYVITSLSGFDQLNNPAWELWTFRNAYKTLVQEVDKYQVWRLDKI